MAAEYDLIVIGTGTAGSIPAFKCRQAGWKVAIIDEKPFGGTCGLRGCDPKKILTGAAEVIDRCRLMSGKGITGQAGIDWKSLIHYKRTFTEPMPEKRQQGFAEAGIDGFHGPARFTDRDQVTVAGEKTLRGRHFVIASGGAPVPLPIPGAEFLTTSEQFLESEELPRAILFIGGGFISFEFAWVAAAAGAKAVILQMDDRPLAGFDRELVAMLVKGAGSRGIEIRLNMPAESIERRNGRLLVRAGDHEFEAEMVVHGAGRIAKVDDLGLEQADVRYDRRGILVNEYMQSISNPAVYAAGDCAAAGEMLTPVAALHGRTAAANLLHGNKVKAGQVSIPSVVFTHPPLAGVGLLPEEAEQQGLDFSIHEGDTASWYAARRIGLEEAGYKVLIEKSTGRILGAHLLGHGSEEAINIFALAMRLGLPAADLRQTIWTYPSAVSDIDYML